MLFTTPSRRPDGDCIATVRPTATGMRTATASQISRTRPGGTELDIGTKANTNSAARGAATPINKIGHAAAAAITPQRKSCRVPVTRPKRLTTAQSSKAERILPNVRAIRLMMVWISAIETAQR